MSDIKILVVEDEAVTAMDIKKTLEKFGYKVSAIESSAEEAIATAEKLLPDLVLMDIVLKGKMDGTQAAQIISHNLQIPIVFLTAYGDFKTFNLAKSSIPYGYLTKPFEPGELRIGVDLALFKHQMEKISAAETTRIKNEFIANMSHEFRTPLNGIIGFTELMYEEKLGKINPEHKKYLGDVLSNSLHLQKLIDGVLNLAEIESGLNEFTPEKIDMHRLIKDACSEQNADINEKKIHIDISISRDLTDVVADYETLKQALSNYISNAVKFSSHGGKVEINAYTNDDYLRIDVKDNGIGIDADNINKLFIPFQQLDSSKSKNYQGTGLGLAMAQRLIKAHGGRVGAESNPGTGSTFYFVLPCKFTKRI